MPLTVHHLSQSSSERVIWLCEELGIPYNLKVHQRDPNTTQAPPELKALHFTGQAPVIVDEHPVGTTTTLAECSAILRYISHVHASGRLFPTPAEASYPQILYWYNVIGGSLLPAMTQCIIMQLSKLGEQEGVGQALAKDADAKVKRLVGEMNRRLGETGSWLAGKEFTAADIMAAYPFTTMRIFFQLDLSEYPALLAWLERVGKREAFRGAIDKGDPRMVPALGAAPPDMWAAFREKK